jgi:hypothetical protein
MAAPKYFIFDMDETLAELYSVYYFLASLRLKEACEEDKLPLPDTLLTSLQDAYKLFVDGILRQGDSLGILRPGILSIMAALHRLKQANKIKDVIIYSNNGHLESLEFIRDIIHKHLNTTDLIKECIHWNHPMREEERTTQPGAANKTWSVLKNIMISGNCKAEETLEPNDVFFFDDLDHIDLRRYLKNNYYKVPAYTFRASFDRIAHTYKDALEAAHVDTSILLDYVIKLFVENDGIMNNSKLTASDKIIKLFRLKTPGTAAAINSPPPAVTDYGIRMMKSAVSRVASGNKQGGARYPRAKTKRRRRIQGTLTRGKKKLKWRP